MISGPRILTFDIESAPLEAWVWGIWDQNVGLDFIKTDWSILSYAAKWMGSNKVIYEDTGGRGKDKVRDDKPLMGKLWELLNAADIVIAQNGKKFDVRKVNARFIQHGIGPPSPYRVIDTMLVARKHFAFTSQKLAHTSSILTDTPKDAHRRFPGFKLWEACLADDPKAWAEMRKYNKRDVVATEKVYLKMRPWIDQHPNVGAYDPSDTHTCPKCGGDKLQRRGVAVTQQGRYPRLQCMGCGGWSRGKTALLPLNQRKMLLVPQ